MYFKKSDKPPINEKTTTDYKNTSENIFRIMEETLAETIIEKRRSRRWGIFFKILGLGYLVGLTLLFADIEFVPDTIKVGQEHTAFVRIIGPIGASEKSNAYEINSNLESAFKEKGVRGVVLEINSPGGSPVQSEYIYQSIIKLKELYPKIPVHALISDIGASGAYYIAVAADKIHASPSSIIGSIGVVVAGFGFDELIKKLGVERRIIVSGDSKATLDPFLPELSNQRVQIQRILDDTHDLFIKRVKKGRHGRLIENGSEPIFDGRVWSGRQALELGLIDSFSDPDKIAKDIIGASRRIYYESEEGLFDRMSREFGVGVSIGMASVMNQEILKFVKLRY